MTNEMMTEMSETGELPEFEEHSVGLMALSNKYAFINNEQILSNLVVFSTDYILDQSFTSQTYYNNGDYFISIINNISGKENGIYIVPKDLTSPTYETNDAQISRLRTVFMFIIPAAVAAAGIIVWLRRRHK